MATARDLVISKRIKLFLLIFLLGTVFTDTTDEFRLVNNTEELLVTSTEETQLNHDNSVEHSSEKKREQCKTNLADILGVDKHNGYYKLFTANEDRYYAMKGLTFSIYDDKMRETAIALFQLVRNLEKKDFECVKHWARRNINDDMFEYVWRFASLYSDKFGYKYTEPPFITKPNYFIIDGTIRKALTLKLNNGKFNNQDAISNQYFRTDDGLSINTNYSGWHLLPNECLGRNNYLTEDIALNSYYFGIHLLHPFWMYNDELDRINIRHAEHYFFVHKNLMARNILEKEHINQRGIKVSNQCEKEYNSYLVYDNGLPFPIRSDYKADTSGNLARVKAINIAIKECLAKGTVMMDNGTTIKISEENYVELLTKFVRARLDSPKTAKLVRSVYGYKGKTIPGRYNPAPSLMHHPETSLRDPVYWYIIQYFLSYFNDLTKTQYINPYDLSKYKTEEFRLLETNVTRMSTYFDYYQFSINKVVDGYNYYKMGPLLLTARQRRMNHMPFTINFTIESSSADHTQAALRFFLGPQCNNVPDCLKEFSNFFQLDVFRIYLEKGVNVVSWSPETSENLSSDDCFNKELPLIKENKYKIYKFPKSLILPRGLEEGLNFTLFVMVTPADKLPELNLSSPKWHEHFNYGAVDNKPFGFPFHRPATDYDYSASNYKFYNITIFHDKKSVDCSGFFSNNLY